MTIAQRRPERQPRLHVWGGGIQVIRDDAQRRPERQPRLHVSAVVRHAELPLRSTKAGASTPATPAQTCMCATPTIALNEGRSVNPGYTYSSIHSLDLACTAQRRPERQPRLHVWGGGIQVIRDDAQRRPERQPRLHHRRLHGAASYGHRSTKAGASTPATLSQPAAYSAEPGPRSTKAGASTPATLLNSAKGQYRDKPSLVHGCGSLDNDAFASISRDFGRYPVRMVGIKQSRLP